MEYEEEYEAPEGFKYAGHIDVDAGSIWVGDGCYVLKDDDEERPKDFGKNWHDICERFFERSGYEARQKEWQKWDYGREDFLFSHPEFRAWSNSEKENPTDHHNVNSDAYKIKHDIIGKIYKEYEKEHPFIPVNQDLGFANFNHDGGHSGMGIMIDTNYGDGSYPVYIKYGKNGRPSKVLIDFYGDDE